MSIEKPSVEISVELELAFLLQIDDVCKAFEISREDFIYEALLNELVRCCGIIKRSKNTAV